MSLHSRRPTQSNLANAIHRFPRMLVPIALLLTTYLYLYPIFLGCVFPSIDDNSVTAYRDTLAQHYNPAVVNSIDTTPYLAPFRLLVLADPQLEGDSSLPKPEDALRNKLVKHWERLSDLGFNDWAVLSDTVRDVVEQVVIEDIPRALRAARKRLDLFGNDYYLAHIFRTLHWWTKPTHVTVLGDLIGSQWVDDAEFEWRGWRYWNRVFAGTEKVPDDLMEAGTQGSGIYVSMDDPSWKKRIINLVGNHDIGYAGDITRERVERFEKKYGLVNWDMRFEYPANRVSGDSQGLKPMLHLVVLNSMLLDTPAMDEDLQGNTYRYLNDLTMNRLRPVEDRTDFTLLLTHVPLHKKEGICVDAPMFKFWEDDDCKGDCKVGGLKEQNHLSVFASQSGVLSNLFGMSGNLDAAASGRGRPGLILTGHDHEGCDAWHYIPDNTTFRGSDPTPEGEEKKTAWEASKWKDASGTHTHTGVREVTLRSMMGEFEGNAGLLSAWFDFRIGEWQYDIRTCKLGVQHIWWAVHVVDLVALVSVLLSTILRLHQTLQPAKPKQQTGKKSLKVE